MHQSNQIEVTARIHSIRGQRIMLDSDLADLYQVETKNLNKAVARNRVRFPPDFMFQLTNSGLENLRFQIGTSISTHGGRRTLPYVFTEQGVAMLSGVLRSEQAVQVHIAIMRAFVRFREALEMNVELHKKLDEIEQKVIHHDQALKSVFQAIRQLMDHGLPPQRKRIKPPQE